MNSYKPEMVTITGRVFEELCETDRRYCEVSKDLRITTDFIAHKFNIVQSTIYGRPWMMPNNGQPNLGKKRSWTFNEYFDWEAIPEEERKQNYLNTENSYPE